MKILSGRLNYITIGIATVFLTISNANAIQKFGTNVRVLDKTSLQISVWGNGYAMKASLEKLILKHAALNSKKNGFDNFSLINSHYSTEKSSANFVSKSLESKNSTMKYSTNKNGKVIENNNYQPPELVSINYDRYLLSTIVLFSTSDISDNNNIVYNADSILSGNVQYQHYFEKSNNAVASTALTISAPSAMLASENQINAVSTDSRSTTLSNKISTAFSTEQWEDTIRLSSELIVLEPKNHIAYSTRAGALAEIHLLQDALRDVNIAINLMPDYKNSYHNRAYIFELLGQKQNAILNYDTACNLGISMSCLEHDKLTSSLKSAASVKTLSTDTLLVLTDRAYEQKKWFDAIKYSTKIILLDPSHFIALTNRSGALEKINLPHYALRDVNLAISLQSNYQKSYHYRATIFAKLNQGENSITNYKKACDMGSSISCTELSNISTAAISPDSVNAAKTSTPHIDTPEIKALLAATDRAFTEKNWTKVIRLSSNIVDQDPGNFIAYSNRSGALAELGLLEDALRDANKAIFLQPNYVNSFHNLGYIYTLMDDYASASINYKSACDKGIAVSCQEYQSISKRDTKPINRVNPDVDTLMAKIKSETKQKQWQNVIKTSTDILKQDPMSPRAFSSRARALANIQLLSYALRDANHAIALQPDFNDSYTNRAYVYALLEDKGKAKSDYKRACDLGAKSSCEQFDILNGSSQVIATNTNKPAENNVELAAMTSVQDLLLKSQSAFGDKQWQKVISLSNKIIKQDSVNFLAYSNRSGAYAETGKYVQALEDVNKALNLNSDFKNAYHNRAYIHSLMKNNINAVADYEKACTLGIEASCSEFNKLTSLAKNNASNDETTQKLVKMPSVDDLLAATTTAFADKKWNTVIELSTKIINQNRSNFLAFSNRSGAFAEKGRLKQALRDVNKSIALNKDFRNSYHNRAYIYSLMNSNLEAATDYQKACDLGISQSCDELAKLQTKLALIESEKKEEPTAIRLPSVDDLLAATTAAFSEKNWDKVIELSTKIINQNRRNFLAYSNRSGAFAEKGKLKQALKDVNKSINLNKDFKNSYHNRAYIHSLMNNSSLAKTDYEKACELGVRISCTEATKLSATAKLDDNPQSNKNIDVNPSIVILLAATNNAFSKKQWTEVIKLSTEIIKRDPKNYLAYSNRSGALAEQGYLKDALTDVNEALSLKPDYYHAYHNRAYIFSLLNDVKSAALDYKNACDRGISASCEEYGKITAVANAKLQ